MEKRTGLARRLRAQSTDAERKLWSRLRGRRLLGLKFRRQVPIDGYVVDFLSAEAKLILEVDGGQHAERLELDRERTRVFESMGYLVLRVWNNDVLNNVDGVLELIADTIRPEVLEPPHPARSGAPTSPHRGED